MWKRITIIWMLVLVLLVVPSVSRNNKTQNLEEDHKVSPPIEEKEEEKIEYTSSKDDEPGKEYEVKINKDLLPPKLLKQEEDRILEEQRKSRMYAEKMTAPDKEIVEAEKEIQEDYKEKKYEKR